VIGGREEEVKLREKENTKRAKKSHGRRGVEERGKSEQGEGYKRLKVLPCG